MPSRAAPSLLAMILLAGTVSADVVERVLAAVDDTPVLLSEVRALERLKRIGREAALQALIDQTLMLREASRLKEAAPLLEEEQRALLSLKTQLAPGAASLDEELLRRIARRESVILKYVELRFRPQLRVDDAELLSAYQEQYGGRPGAPPFEAVESELSASLTSRALESRIEAWVAELRSGARIRLNPDAPQS
jgi:hypothetical protein